MSKYCRTDEARAAHRKKMRGKAYDRQFGDFAANPNWVVEAVAKRRALWDALRARREAAA